MVKKQKLSEVMLVHFSSVTFSQTSHYVWGFCGSDAHWSYTFKDDENSTSRFNFSNITKDVVVAMRSVCLCVCVSVCNILSVVVCYFQEHRLLLTFKPTGNGKWYSWVCDS